MRILLLFCIVFGLKSRKLYADFSKLRLDKWTNRAIIDGMVTVNDTDNNQSSPNRIGLFHYRGQVGRAGLFSSWTNRAIKKVPIREDMRYLQAVMRELDTAQSAGPAPELYPDANKETIGGPVHCVKCCWKGRRTHGPLDSCPECKGRIVWSFRRKGGRR